MNVTSSETDLLVESRVGSIKQKGKNANDEPGLSH